MARALTKTNIVGSIVSGIGAALLIVVFLSFQVGIEEQIAKTIGPSKTFFIVMWVSLGIVLTPLGFLITRISSFGDLDGFEYPVTMLAFFFVMCITFIGWMFLLESPKENVGLGILQRMHVIENRLTEAKHNVSAQDPASRSIQLALDAPTPSRVYGALMLTNGGWRASEYQNALQMISILEMNDDALFAQGMHRGWFTRDERIEIRKSFLNSKPPIGRMQQEAWLRLVGNVEISKPIELGGVNGK